MTVSNSEYKNHYKQFSQNVAFAARTWHRYVYLNNRASEDEVIANALNKAASFWNDFDYSAAQTTIIFLGKIFDNDGRTYNIDKTIKSAKDEQEYFNKDGLKKRKIEIGGEFEGIDEYIKNASELDFDDLKAISIENKKAKVIWERVKPLRDQIYAHNEMLSDTKRDELYKSVKNSDINDILQILVNISNALWEAEFNGRKPNFSSNHTQPIEWAKKDIEDLISSLSYSESTIKSQKQ